MDRKEHLSNTGIITEADVQAFRGGRNCPVMGLFRAGAIQREEITQREESEGESEIYVPELAYDESLYEGYLPGAKIQIVKAYGLVTVKPDSHSDGCSGGQKDKTDYYDRRVPCQAHDYCYDLIRFAVAPSLSVSDCDDKFHDLMNSDCADRGPSKNKCKGGLSSPWLWTQMVQKFSTVKSEVDPGVVVIQNVETGWCVDVEGSSDEDGARLIQWPCEEDNGQISNNRRFRFNIRRDLNDAWYFHIQPEHQPRYCASVTDNNAIVLRHYNSCFVSSNNGLRFASSSLFILVEDNEHNEERYTIRSGDSSTNRCWSPATSKQGSRLINSSPCHRDSDLHLWEIREVEE